MSTFATSLSKGIKAFTRSPTSKKQVLQAVKDYSDETKVMPERISFILWDPVDKLFQEGLEVAYEENSPYVKVASLYVHEYLPLCEGIQVDLCKGPVEVEDE